MWKRKKRSEAARLGAVNKIRGYSVRVPPTGLRNPEVGDLLLVGLDHLFSLNQLGEEGGNLL